MCCTDFSSCLIVIVRLLYTYADCRWCPIDCDLYFCRHYNKQFVSNRLYGLQLMHLWWLLMRNFVLYACCHSHTNGDSHYILSIVRIRNDDEEREEKCAGIERTDDTWRHFALTTSQHFSCYLFDAIRVQFTLEKKKKNTPDSGHHKILSTNQSIQRERERERSQRNCIKIHISCVCEMRNEWCKNSPNPFKSLTSREQANFRDFLNIFVFVVRLVWF